MALPAPQLTQQQYEAVRDLASALIMETDGRERFTTATHEGLLLAAETSDRYRLTTVPIIRQADLVARRMSLQDPSRIGPNVLPGASSDNATPFAFYPMVVRNRDNAKVPPCEEIVHQVKLRRYAADLEDLGAFFKTNQLMANCISRELARANIQVPSYAPYIVADVSGAP